MQEHANLVVRGAHGWIRDQWSVDVCDPEEPRAAYIIVATGEGISPLGPTRAPRDGRRETRLTGSRVANRTERLGSAHREARSTLPQFLGDALASWTLLVAKHSVFVGVFDSGPEVRKREAVCGL